MSSGSVNENSESEPQQASPSKIEALGQLPDNDKHQENSQKALVRSNKVLRPLSGNNGHRKDKRVFVSSTEDPGPLSDSENNNKGQQEDQVGSTGDKKQATEGRGVQSRRITNSQQQPSEVLTEQQVIDKWKQINAELMQKSAVPWIKSLVVLRILFGHRRAVSFRVQDIEAWERMEAEHTRQRIVNWLLGLFVAWVVLGLIVFIFHGTIWPLLAAPVLAFPFRKAIRFYFPKQGNPTNPPISPKQWWKFWRS